MLEMTPDASPETHPLELPFTLGGVNDATIDPAAPCAPCARYAEAAGSQIADAWMSKQIWFSVDETVIDAEPAQSDAYAAATIKG